MISLEIKTYVTNMNTGLHFQKRMSRGALSMIDIVDTLHIKLKGKGV